MKHTPLPWLSALCLTVACGSGPGGGETTDPTDWVGSISITAMQFPCDPDGWTYSIDVAAPRGSELVLNTFVSGANSWTEEHRFDAEDSPLFLAQADADTWVPGVSTGLVCGLHDSEPVTTWAARLYGNDDLDCVILGNDEVTLFEVVSGTPPDPDAVSDPDDLRGCREWTLLPPE